MTDLTNIFLQPTRNTEKKTQNNGRVFYLWSGFSKRFKTLSNLLPFHTQRGQCLPFCMLSCRLYESKKSTASASSLSMNPKEDRKKHRIELCSWTGSSFTQKTKREHAWISSEFYSLYCHEAQIKDNNNNPASNTNLASTSNGQVKKMLRLLCGTTSFFFHVCLLERSTARINNARVTLCWTDPELLR